MLLLALETSTSQGSIALAKIDDKKSSLVFSKTWLRQKSHGELIVPAIEEALRESDLSLEALDAFAVDIGPGSFTGIRVGLNTIKTLSYAIEKPIYAFNSLELLAYGVPYYSTKTPVLALINAHKSQCYASTFQPLKHGWKTSIKPQALTVEQLEKLIRSKHVCVGEGFDFFAANFSKSFSKRLIRHNFLNDRPSAITMVQIFADRQKQLRPKSWNDISALYIRGSEAEEKLKAGTLKPLPEF